jgi:hypothetical protein
LCHGTIVHEVTHTLEIQKLEIQKLEIQKLEIQKLEVYACANARWLSPCMIAVTRRSPRAYRERCPCGDTAPTAA